MNLRFRELEADEIEIRVGMVKDKGCSLLLYKDSRADMTILDEGVGTLNWKREHTRDNKNCIVSIWDDGKGQWVSKEDTGTESNTEQQKGLASDSFKRACVNWGIGRELYTSPFIWVNLKNSERYESGKDKYGKVKYQLSKNVKFKVKEITYDEKRRIKNLVIVDQDNEVRFSTSKNVVKSKPKVEKKVSTEKQELINVITEDGEFAVTNAIAMGKKKNANCKQLSDLTVEQLKWYVDKKIKKVEV